jgi:protoheme IX farnesyltransferase
MTRDSSGAVPGSAIDEAKISRIADFVTLTKARLSLLVVFTTAIGFCVGSNGAAPWVDLIFAILGTSLACASASSLNQWMESEVDQLMDRTKDRPLAAGRWSRSAGLSVGVVLGVAGLLILWLTLPLSAPLLALATIVIYLLVYTPLKRRSAWCVLIGAVSGALPPVIGWSATGSKETWLAWVLFGILFCWQIPHFLAIAWMYRDEYRQAGFVMLKEGDEDGLATSTQALVFSVLLSIVTMVPVFLGEASTVYRFIVLVVDVLFCGAAIVFLVERSRVSARRLFFMSIIYLPLILGLLAFVRKF